MLVGSLRHVVTGLLIAVLSLGGGGCATIMSEGGGDRPLHVSSEPAGATVYLKRGGADWQRQPGLTPTTLYLDPSSSSANYQLKLELDGYEPALGYVNSDVDPWLFGSMALVLLFVIPGLVATGVDFATGAWKKLDTDSLHFDFRAPGTAPATQP